MHEIFEQNLLSKNIQDNGKTVFTYCSEFIMRVPNPHYFLQKVSNHAINCDFVKQIVGYFYTRTFTQTDKKINK